MRNKGFTLVEILVVLVIIAVMLSMAVLSINVAGRDSQLHEESRRIVGLLDLLHDRALLEGRDFGLLVEPRAYEFLVYDNFRDRWQPFDTQREFRRRELPKGLSLRLELDARQVVLKAPPSELAADAAPPTPQIAIAASGEGTPFRLTLVRDATGATSVVSGDAFGKTKLERPKAPARAS
ncbi:MAG TPA: type II secretion system minor pseudopilin GspH [Steroidobacteraceae bacterium]|nr:type II secretion system minor pseudopilin GspH [Steroidobacteraceae bacterium]